MSSIYNPTDPAFQANPYPVYELLRKNAPVEWLEPAQAWVLSRYEHVNACLRHPKMGVDMATAFRAVAPDDPRVEVLAEMSANGVLYLNPPEHSRIRTLITKAFTPRIVENLRPQMEDLVNRLLDRVAPTGKMEVIADLAFPLPITVIAMMLGVPAEDHENFKNWSAPLAMTIEPYVTPDVLVDAEKSAKSLREYLVTLVEKKRSNPGNDLISAMIQAEDQGKGLSSTELVANAGLLLITGHETTVHLVGNGLKALLDHPQQLQLLRNNPKLIESAIEEFLRFEAPVQTAGRVATDEVTILDQQIEKGQELILLLGSANRDSNAFTDPDSLNISRNPNQHLAFGAGIHFCLGAALAKLEGQIAIGSLIRRFTDIKLACDHVTYRPSAALRALEELPITFRCSDA